MSPDTKFNTCSIEQELSDDDIDRELRRAEALELVRLRSGPAACMLFPDGGQSVYSDAQASQAAWGAPSSLRLPPVTAAQAVQSDVALCGLHMHVNLAPSHPRWVCR